MRPLPSLYPITDASRQESLSSQVARLGEVGFPLIQFRGKPLDPKAQWAELQICLRAAHQEGGWPLICLNDRADLAVLAIAEGLRIWGLHLGQGDLPPSEAIHLPGLSSLRWGGSTHGPRDWASLATPVDHAGVGPFRATGSKAFHAPPIGLEGLRQGAAALRAKDIAPIAIGGLTRKDAEACFQAGAESMAMIGEVARSEDPAGLGWEVQVARMRARPWDLRKGVILLGSSGAGKTTLGTLLAARLGLPFHDLDALVEEGTGKKIPELFEAHGEGGFRALELDHLEPLLTKPVLIALGGGAWQTEALRRAVRASGYQTLWLAEPPGSCWARVGGDPRRPLAQDREAFLARHRERILLWSEEPSVSSFGRGPELLASALVP